MVDAPNPPIRRSPRWMRRFVVWSRRANFFLVLELATLAALATMIATTWLSFDSAPADGQLLPTQQVATLLIGTMIPAMALLSLIHI